MSAWILTVREIAERGPLCTSQMMRGSPKGAGEARRLGLLVSPGRRGSASAPWCLTPLGREYVEGRAVLAPRGGHGERVRGALIWRATWLASLPRPGEVMLTQYPTSARGVDTQSASI